MWFRVPKVCTRTILYGFLDSGLRLDAEHPYSVHYHVGEFAGFFKFAFVRNPWDRLVRRVLAYSAPQCAGDGP